ncbi:hypothetical protein SSBR45G_65590 [Bradyrhizobium sp. SSBR45G]|uniref:hypothetical protein n=1 Tax=unclassified Bradyrhizobium TaxID=2631580 RepID=UPI002342A403|nr:MULTISPECIES: hypothetical protein [unclassified Bradyrhizobium]GLH81650.1 hypothetical protein SSBR45G_65590 [Bradyrhizobium sp. SSBR45G]GLH89072.1 hypothetical protein SSBR45R_65330 [Bradyrhizobium sp. SSBR45R]
MRKLLLATAFVIASAAVSAQAQTIDVGSILSANGISIGKGGGQPQAGGQQGAATGMAQGAGQQQGGQSGQDAAGQGQSQGQSQKQASRAKQPRESAQETRARNIAAKYGISW